MIPKNVVLSALLLISVIVSACGLSVQPTLMSTVTPVLVTFTPEATLTPTLTPAPTPLPNEITNSLGVTMRLVPAGKFTMGSENGNADEKPVHTVTLDAFYMDVYEVTNARYKACVDARGCIPPPKFEGRFYNYYKAGYDDYPVDAKDWNMSQMYCEWRGASLPTEAQWEKAARGPDQRTYPWGEGIDKSFANYDRSIKQVAENNNSGTTRVGSYQLGISPYGMYDMAGNVWEWVGDWYDENYYAQSPASNPLGPEIGYARVLRGGFWNGPVDMLRTSARSAYDPNNSPEMLGFRCARSAVEIANASSSATSTPEIGSGATQLPDIQDPTTLPTELTDSQSVSMKLVPAGPFTMGSEIQPVEQPMQTVTLGAFYMDVYEVTNARYKACVEAGVCTTPGMPKSTSPDKHYGIAEFDNYPVVFVTWKQSIDYCAWRGARLPTEAEWEKAARGNDQRTYPWGEDIDKTLANYDTSNTTAVGSYPQGVSPYGMFDMAGNVSEWVSSLYRPYPYNADDGREDLSLSGSRVLRGGHSYWGADILRSAYRMGYDSISTSYHFLGFRCARSSP